MKRMHSFLFLAMVSWLAFRNFTGSAIAQVITHIDSDDDDGKPGIDADEC